MREVAAPFHGRLPAFLVARMEVVVGAAKLAQEQAI